MRVPTMHNLIRTLLLAVVVTIAAHTDVQGQEAASTSYYLIGNSLTWDTMPGSLDGDVQWHVDCGVSLPYISANPAAPCVKASTIWPTALGEKQYDFVSVQPHYGATLAQDVETISAWMKLQPEAVFVIHSGWALQTERAAEFASYTSPDQMVHSPGYIRALISELRRLHPGREVRQTLAQNLLAQVAEDIAAGSAPLEKLETLYRDAIHLTLDHGRYVAHNAMRRAMGQSRSAAGFSKQDPELKRYLDGVLSLLDTSPTDKSLLTQVLSADVSIDRAALIAKVSDAALQTRLTALLPDIERASKARHVSLALAKEVEDVGGKVVWSPSGPQWLYLATQDTGTEIFDVITTVDLYNGNNPLKGRGGRNEQVNDDWLQRLSGLTTLRRLDVSNCAIHGEGLRHIAALSGLRELNLTLTPVTDAGLQHLGGLTELRTLGLASTQCTGSGFVHLKALRKLQSVNFHFTPLNDAGLRAISQVPIADRFWFAHTHFTDQGAESLATLIRLKRCGIGSKEQASSGDAVAALTKLPLEDLSLLDNQATPAGIAHASQISTLQKLDVSYAPTVTDESMELVAKMPKLQEFRIGSAQLTDAGLQMLAMSKSLKKLTISGLKNVTPQGVDALQKVRPDLVIERR
jgi:hypothetical protein